MSKGWKWAYDVSTAPSRVGGALPLLIEALYFERLWSDCVPKVKELQDLFPVHEAREGGGFVRRPERGRLVNYGPHMELIKSLGGIERRVHILWVVLERYAAVELGDAVKTVARDDFLPDYSEWMPVDVTDPHPVTLYKTRIVVDRPTAEYAVAPSMGTSGGGILTPFWLLPNDARNAFFPHGYPTVISHHPCDVFRPAKLE